MNDTTNMSRYAEQSDVSPVSPADPLERYAQYPFDSDETYKQGLASLLANGAVDACQPSHMQEEILRRTRVFYFNSITGCTISADDAREYETSHRNLPLTSTETDTRMPAPPTDEQRVLTFAELQELIETGRVDQIPNNKAVPDALNAAAPSESTTPVRKKPWETS